MKLTKLIKKQVGNGGKKYWKFAGFSSRIEWCGAFVYWALSKCDEDFEYMKAKENPFYVPNIEAWAKKNKRTIKKSKARRGDIVTFDWNGNGSGDHVGFIWSNYGNGTYICLEGNTGGGAGEVMLRTRYASQINTVIRLKENKKKETSTSASTSAAKTTKEASKKSEEKAIIAINQKYKVISEDGMNIRTKPKKSGTKIGAIPYGTTFRAIKKDGNWVYSTKYKGWICLKEDGKTYLRKVD